MYNYVYIYIYTWFLQANGAGLCASRPIDKHIAKSKSVCSVVAVGVTTPLGGFRASAVALDDGVRASNTFMWIARSI